MTAEPSVETTDAVARLAGLVESLGEFEWRDYVRAAGINPHPDFGSPTWGNLARTGLDVVEYYAARDEGVCARDHAAFLADYFMRTRKQLHGVAGVAFEGLSLAARAHDTDELEDHADLIRELFGDDQAALETMTQ